MEIRITEDRYALGKSAAKHIAQVLRDVIAERGHARIVLSTGASQFDTLEALTGDLPLETTVLPCPGTVTLAEYTVTCAPAEEIINNRNTFTILPVGGILLRARASGDAIRLSGGSKTLKKLFIDRKIPASARSRIPVLADENGVLAVFGIGTNLDRAATALPAVQIHIEKKVIGG